LALTERNLVVKVYESRPPKSEAIVSGVILTPNGLRVLDRLGVLPRIKDRCYITTHRVFKNGRDETIRKSLISGESLYGYSNHRVWRAVLLDEMKQMLAERNVQIQYGAKFRGIISDSVDGVQFRVSDYTHHAAMLVGVDGIYSTVRQYLVPDIVPEYTGTVAVLSHIKRASVSWPYDEYELNATIQDIPGAIFFIAEDPEGKDIMVGLQKQSPEYSRKDLDELQQDKDKLVDFYRARYDDWGPTARSIIDQVANNKEQCFIWPFLKVPTLPKWFSDTGRVILCGDGAHGLPPSSGQGINQCLEDIYSLTLLLEAASSGRAETGGVTHEPGRSQSMQMKALAYWQSMRQRRVDAVFEWATNSTNVQRMSEEDRKNLINQYSARERVTAQVDDMSWLYQPNLEDDIKTWIAEHL